MRAVIIAVALACAGCVALPTPPADALPPLEDSPQLRRMKAAAAQAFGAATVMAPQVSATMSLKCLSDGSLSISVTPKP